MHEDTTWQPVWEELFAGQEWGKYPPEHVIRFVARRWHRLPQRGAVRILDLGCGPGACTWFMAREGYAVSGIDGSKSAIEITRKRLAQDGLEADLHCGDYSELPWPDNTFDGVIDNATLCCNPFHAVLKVRDEVLRVLKPGGHFQSANFTDRSWGFGLGRKITENEYDDIPEGPHFNRGYTLFMSRKQVDELLAPFTDRHVELLSYTCERMTRIVELWLMESRKA